MENFANDAPELRDEAFQETAAQLGMSKVIVEKDFWVSCSTSNLENVGNIVNTRGILVRYGATNQHVQIENGEKWMAFGPREDMNPNNENPFEFAASNDGFVTVYFKPNSGRTPTAIVSIDGDEKFRETGAGADNTLSFPVRVGEIVRVEVTWADGPVIEFISA